jgi:PilZ domain
MGPMSRNELEGRLRREAFRYSFHVAAKIVWSGGGRWGHVTNISRTGMFIKTIHPPDLGTFFSVYLALDTPLRLECIVRRVVPRRGIGVTLSVPQEERKRFAALLVALARSSEPNAMGASVPKPEPPKTMTAVVGAVPR